MKGMKKLLSILMVLTLVLSLGATAFAATITIDTKPTNDKEEHTYVAYQIFTGTQGEGDNGALGDIKWGANVDGDSFLTALKADNAFLGADNKNIFADCVDAKDVAKVLGDNQTYKEAFAAFVEKNKTGDPIPLAAGENNIVIDGYYLIVDTTSVEGKQTAQNKSMLQVTDIIHIQNKYDVPSSEKKVMDANDSELPITVKPGSTNERWKDSADHDIGDIVYFRLSGTMPSDLEADYDEYEVIFHDKEDPGLTFQAGSVEVYVGDSTTPLENPTDGEPYYVVTAPGSGGCTFDVSFKNVKDIPGVTDGTTIYVVYSSQLNTNAKLGATGNWNELEMEYTNTSDNEGHGRTPVNKVVVFTYDLNVNKITKENGVEQDLLGADFALFKEVDEDYVLESGKSFTWVNKKTGERSTTEKTDADWVKCVEVTLEKSNTTGSGDGKNKFYGKGVDDGTYLLVETVTPPGFNSIDPYEFNITATHVEEADIPTLTGVVGDGDIFAGEFELNPAEGSAMKDAKVINDEGATLPETGGIGTTIFYIAGAILVAGAVILLVTKKRVNGMEK